MIVVGYNDNVWVDVNGNGVHDEGEYGAFKIANSWGTSGTNTNSGFMWVLYDALNGKTSIPGNWENQYSSVRKPAFAFYTTNNYLNQLKVENKKVNYGAEVSVTADKLSQMTVSVGKSPKSYSYSTINHAADNFSLSKSASHTGNFVYDMNSVMSNIYNEYTGYKWYLNIGDSISDSNYIRNVTYKITDNTGNVIKNGGSVASINGTTKNLSAEINLVKGDVDYSGEIELKDAQTVLKASLNSIALSNVQNVIADYDGDGKITNNDAQLILTAAILLQPTSSVCAESEGLLPTDEEEFLAHLVENYTIGDVDKSYSVTLKDAASVLKYALNLKRPDTVYQKFVSDSDGDGEVSLGDVSDVLKTALNLKDAKHISSVSKAMGNAKAFIRNG